MSNASGNTYIGIDLGGTKIEGAVVHENGEVVERTRIAAPQGSYDETLNAIAGLVGIISPGETSTKPVGIGVPGSLSPATGLMRNANSTWLNGHPLDQDLSDLMGRPVRIANDANCFTLSEGVDGAGAGANIVFGVILGTGVGGGITVQGQLLTGLNAIAGEWGHNPLPWPRDDERPGPKCYCGRRGCIETWLSGPGFNKTLGETDDSKLVSLNIESYYKQGNRSAIRGLEAYADRAARALGQVINILDPEVIVLGGGLSNLSPLYDLIPPRLVPYVFSDVIRTRIVPNVHGDSSGVRGAAWLWRDAP